MSWPQKIAAASAALAQTPHTPVPSSTNLAQTFDHTLLKPDATAAQISDLCREAAQHKFATVCVRAPFAAQASDALQGTGVGVCCVIGFPDPAALRVEEKLGEARAALAAGAAELDLVMQWARLKERAYDGVYAELRALRDAVPKGRAVLKVILETSQLEREDVVAACVIAREAEFEYVKTSTGFLGEGARVRDVELMSRMCAVLGGGMKVKASGGIRAAEDAFGMLRAGASRLGASASVAIMESVREGMW